MASFVARTVDFLKANILLWILLITIMRKVLDRGGKAVVRGSCLSRVGCKICISERLNALIALRSQRERALHAWFLSWIGQRLFLKALRNLTMLPYTPLSLSYSPLSLSASSVA